MIARVFVLLITPPVWLKLEIETAAEPAIVPPLKVKFGSVTGLAEFKLSVPPERFRMPAPAMAEPVFKLRVPFENFKVAALAPTTML